MSALRTCERACEPKSPLELAKVDMVADLISSDQAFWDHLEVHFDQFSVSFL